MTSTMIRTALIFANALVMIFATPVYGSGVGERPGCNTEQIELTAQLGARKAINDLLVIEERKTPQNEEFIQELTDALLLLDHGLRQAGMAYSNCTSPSFNF